MKTEFCLSVLVQGSKLTESMEACQYSLGIIGVDVSFGFQQSAAKAAY